MFRKLLITAALATILVQTATGQVNYRHKKTGSFPAEAEIRFSHGLLPLTYDFDLDLFSWDDCFAPPSVTDQYYGMQSYRGNRYNTGSLNIGHSVKVAKWLELGATFSYVGSYQNIYSSLDNRVIDRETTSSLFFTPTVRFAWFNREWVRMYSSVGLGVGVMVQHPYSNSQSATAAEPYIEWGPSIQLTGFGISVGKRLFWFTEVQTVGTLGVFIMGAGFRITPDKRGWHR